MTAVRLTDAVGYGARFVGSLALVAIAGGVLVAGGALLGATEITLTDPSMETVTEPEIAAGLVLSVVGGLVWLVGLVGLAHKFWTDTLAAAIDGSALAQTAGASGPAGAESGPAPDREVAGASEASEQRTATTADSAPEETGTAEERQSEPQEPPTAPEETAVPDPETDDAEPRPGAAQGEPDQEPTDDGEWSPPDPEEFERPSREDAAASDGARGPLDEQTRAEAVERDETPVFPDDPPESDEAVESVEPDGDGDPLADRLPGEDS